MADVAVLGIDLGTTEAKAALVALDGRLIGMGRASYPLDRGADGRAEQDPADWWAAVAMAVRSIDRAGADIVAVCGVGQGPTLVAVDAAGTAVRPAITWQDRRAGNGGFGLLPKLAWLAREEPSAVEQAAWLMTSWDALGLWLSGCAATTLQSHEAALDAGALRDAGVPAGRIPGPVPVGAVLGGLRAEAAAALGLADGTPVVAGVNDGIASVVGAGLREPGDAVDTGGTSGGIAICADRPLAIPGVYSAPAPIAGRWILGGAMAATGAAVDWLRSAVMGDRWTSDDLFAAAAAVAPGADGLVFLPYLAGERAPIFDDEARGAFVGLTLAHGPGHLARAVLEGGAFALRQVAMPIRGAGLPLHQVRITGRPTPGDLWARIKADVLDVPVAIPTIGDTAVLGAAILAAAGVGAVGDLETGMTAMTSIARRLQPDPAARARYDHTFAVYRDLYPALRSSLHALGG